MSGNGRLASPLRFATAAVAAGLGCALLLLPRPLRSEGPDAPGSSADIELRTSDRESARKPARPSPAQRGARGGGDLAEGEAGVRAAGAARLSARLGAAAAAIGETLQSSGALHLPGVGGRNLVLDGGRHPVLEFGTGRRAILDPQGALGAHTAAEIERRWPDYTVLQPAPEADALALLGGILHAAGYASVARSTPVSFGRGVSVRLVPDFVVLKTDRDLLEGETLLLSVADAAEALPPELRELAAGHRIRIVEVDGEGAPVGSDRAPWTDSAGRVTTMEARRPWLVLTEVAEAVGLTVVRAGDLPAAAGGAPSRVAARVVGRSGSAVILAEPPGPGVADALAARGETPIVVSSAEDLPAAIRSLLAAFEVQAIGPRVELYRPPRAGAARRFTISVPGWLVQAGGRRLLVTGAAPHPLIKRYLGREAVDILEYRVRDPARPRSGTGD